MATQPLPPPLPCFRLAEHIVLDFEAYEHLVAGVPIPMSPRERELLRVLVEKYKMSRRGIVPTQYLIAVLFPHLQDYVNPRQSIRQMCSNIRRKWGEAPRCTSMLVCVHDAGYRLSPQEGYGFEEEGSSEEKFD